MRVLCVVVVAALGCAPTFKTVQPGPLSSAELNATMAAAQAQALQLREAQVAAERSCQPMLQGETPFEEERAIGTRLATADAARTGHFYLDGAALPEGGKNAVSGHVAVVGKNLARYSARPDLPWVFGVIEHDTASAFNAPGGYVFVTTGLLKKLTNEAQLAGVLAHEIGHVVHKHSLTRFREVKHQQCVAARFAASALEHGGAGNPSLAAMARYARNFERPLDLDGVDDGFVTFLMDAMMMVLRLGNGPEAEFLTDQTALELVSFAGYDAQEYEKFLVTFAQPMHPAAAARATKLAALRTGALKDFVHGTAKPDLARAFAPLGR